MSKLSGRSPLERIAVQSGETLVSTLRHDTYPAIDPAKVNLSGKVIVITGASRGIGKSIAVAFAHSGVSGLVLVARTAKSLEAAHAECAAAARPGSNLKILSAPADTTDYSQAAAVVEKAREAFGRVDILVNNAGLMELAGKMTDIDPVVWWSTCEVNIQGTYNVTRAFLPLLIESGGEKTIVNVSSIGAHMVQPTWSAYQLTKLAILRFTELLVVEYGEQGILAIAIHPGSVLTDMGQRLPEEMHVHLEDTVELPGHFTVWLTSERREWLAGRYVSVHWDVDQLLQKQDEIVSEDKLKLRMVV